MSCSIQPSALLLGYGERVCVYLNDLADSAMRASNHHWQPFDYMNKADEGLDAADNDVQETEVNPYDINIEYISISIRTTTCIILLLIVNRRLKILSMQ